MPREVRLTSKVTRSPRVNVRKPTIRTIKRMPGNVNQTDRQTQIKHQMEHRILHGLRSEWELARYRLAPHWQQTLRPPLFRLGTLRSTLGRWSLHRREICISRELAWNHPWNAVRDVLLHEMAHQVAHELLGAGWETPHGPTFQKACRWLGANPKSSGRYGTLQEQLNVAADGEADRVVVKIRKLMALATSDNHHEAEAAMAKAHELIARHNIDLIQRRNETHYVSVFAGQPALRHGREVYHLAHLLQEFYFIQSIWVPAYVLAKGKTGRVLEISGTASNVSLAGYVFDYVTAYNAAQWRWYNRNGKHRHFRRSDFAVGVIDGFRQKLLDKRRFTITAENHALVALADQKLTAYMHQRYPHTRSICRTAAREDAAIRAEGIAAGKRLIIAKGICTRGEQVKQIE